MKKGQKTLPHINLRHKPQEWLERFEMKYGKCDYQVDYDLYPEANGISNINNFYIRSAICAIPDKLNNIIRLSKDSKEILKDILVKIIDQDGKDQIDNRDFKLLHALATKNVEDVWCYFIHGAGVQFAMTDEDKEHIYEFVNDTLKEIISNLDAMIEMECIEQKDSRQERLVDNTKGKNVTWADKITNTNSKIKENIATLRLQ